MVMDFSLAIFWEKKTVMFWHSFGKKYLKMQFLGENLLKRNVHAGLSENVHKVVYQTDKKKSRFLRRRSFCAI